MSTKTKTEHYVSKTYPSGWERPYSGTASGIEPIIAAYTGKASHGSSLVQSIVDTRASFISGRGLQLSISPQYDGTEVGTDELDYINRVLAYNDIPDLLQQMAVLSEIEGRLLLAIDPVAVQGDQLYRIRILPYSLYHYTLDQDDDDLQVINSVTYSSKSNKTVKLNKDEIAYQTFGSTLWFRPADARPRIAACMEVIECLSRARLDWRQINHLYAHPTPVFRCNQQQEVMSLAKALQDAKWTIGKQIVTTADVSILQIDTSAAKNIGDEITSLMEAISGTTGVPVIFLGYTRLLSNRATALSLFEVLDSSVRKERENMVALFSYLFRLILEHANAKMGKNYVTDCVSAAILPPAILEAEERLLDKLTQMYQAGTISLRTLLSYNPYIDDPSAEEVAIAQTQMRGMGDNAVLANTAASNTPAIEDTLTTLTTGLIERLAGVVEIGE